MPVHYKNSLCSITIILNYRYAMWPYAKWLYAKWLRPDRRRLMRQISKQYLYRPNWLSIFLLWSRSKYSTVVDTWQCIVFWLVNALKISAINSWDYFWRFAGEIFCWNFPKWRILFPKLLIHFGSGYSSKWSQQNSCIITICRKFVINIESKYIHFKSPRNVLETTKRVVASKRLGITDLNTFGARFEKVVRNKRK